MNFYLPNNLNIEDLIYQYPFILVHFGLERASLAQFPNVVKIVAEDENKAQHLSFSPEYNEGALVRIYYRVPEEKVSR